MGKDEGIGEVKIKLIKLFIILALLALPVSVSAAPDVEKWERSIVRVNNNTQGGFGTGWVVSENGIIATNHHVIAGGRNFAIFAAGSTRRDAIPAKLLWSDARLDLALLQVPGFSAQPFKLFTNDPIRGSQSYTAGYPAMADAAAQDLSFRISIYSGSVSLVVNQAQSGRRIIQHDTIVNAGNSGGPLLDNCGRVLGVTSEGYADEDVNVVWISVAVSELAKNMDRLNIPYEVDNSFCEPEVMVGTVDTADQHARNTADAANALAEGAQLEVDSLEEKMFTWGVAIIATLAILLILVLRRPRHKQAKDDDDLNLVINHSDGGVVIGTEGNGGKSVVLSGFSSSGKTVRIEFQIKTLEKANKGISIGSSSSLSDCTIADKEISRRHARISVENGKVLIEDLNSTNGTFLNQQELKPFDKKELPDCGQVKIGQLDLTVSKT